MQRGDQTVLCRPGVAYQPDSILSVIDYQPADALYNILCRISPMDLGAPASRNPRPSGRGGGQGSRSFCSIPVSDATVISDPPFGTGQRLIFGFPVNFAISNLARLWPFLA
jgi:hypothetical protein